MRVGDQLDEQTTFSLEPEAGGFVADPHLLQVHGVPVLDVSVDVTVAVGVVEDEGRYGEAAVEAVVEEVEGR